MRDILGMIADLMLRWESGGHNVTLREYLGMTEAEWKAWNTHGTIPEWMYDKQLEDWDDWRPAD